MIPVRIANLRRRVAPVVTAAAFALMLQGCADPFSLAMLEIGAGTGASAGINHTLGGITYKTFTAPADDVHAATLKALTAMDIPVDGDTLDDKTRTIKAHAADRDIGIKIEALTPRTTRLRVVASEDVVFKDSATSTEIIIQSAQALDDLQAERARHAARKVASRAHTH
ncbi:MAG: DUF3568 family protein [Magnetospirillum sp.]|nr:DUF3568 family protein [Magnetospirillum sp.]